ncbi:MAG: adenylyl-sulfate kinase [Ktedonobacteraceae bacterium]
MTQHSHNHTWDSWSGWSTISANNDTSFTIWFTGLPGTGKTTLAHLVRKALLTRGYKVEIIDSQALSYWLKHELQIEDDIQEDRSHTPGYDAFVTYICTLLARNGIITITVAVSPYREARTHAREQIQHFVEVYLYCPNNLRLKRVSQQERVTRMAEQTYQAPLRAEVNIDTGLETSERSALHIIDYLELQGYIAPLWEEADTPDEEIANVKARLQSLGYLD